MGKAIGDEKVLQAFHKCGTGSAASRYLGICQTTVSRILIKHGIRLGKGTRPKNHLLPKDEVISRYLSGESTRVLGKVYKSMMPGSPRPEEVVRRQLKSWGVSRRRSGGWGYSGSRNNQWKGGKTPTMHYHRRLSYEVAAICLGHPLSPAAVIHHFDENPYNNNPENLWIFDSQSVHAKFHQKLLKLQRQGTAIEASQLAKESGARQLQRPLSLYGFELCKDRPAWASGQTAKKRNFHAASG